MAVNESRLCWYVMVAMLRCNKHNNMWAQNVLRHLKNTKCMNFFALGNKISNQIAFM